MSTCLGCAERAPAPAPRPMPSPGSQILPGARAGDRAPRRKLSRRGGGSQGSCLQGVGVGGTAGQRVSEWGIPTLLPCVPSTSPTLLSPECSLFPLTLCNGS